VAIVSGNPTFPPFFGIPSRQHVQENPNTMKTNEIGKSLFCACFSLLPVELSMPLYFSSCASSHWGAYDLQRFKGISTAYG